MFRKLLVTLVLTVVALATQVEAAHAEFKVLPGYGVKPGFISPVVGYYPVQGYSYAPTIYPVYPSFYPTPLVRVLPVATYTVFYKASVYQPYAVYGTYTSHTLAHEVAASLSASGYLARVGH